MCGKCYETQGKNYVDMDMTFVHFVSIKSESGSTLLLIISHIIIPLEWIHDLFKGEVTDKYEKNRDEVRTICE